VAILILTVHNNNHFVTFRVGRIRRAKCTLCFIKTWQWTCMYVCMYPTGKGPAYSGPIRWGLFIAGLLR